MISKILLTGFEPFRQEKVNPSKELALLLGRRWQLDHLILPVSYRRSVEILRHHLAAQQYDYLLMLGEAGKRSEICLERTAVNLISATIPDEDGVPSQSRLIEVCGPELCQTSAPIAKWFEILRAQNFPVQISDSAGTYVCNHLYYQICRDLADPARSPEKSPPGVRPTQALFVHVPYLPEQVLNNPPGTPSMSLEKMAEVLEELLRNI